MTVSVEIETAPTAAQMEAWRRLMSLLLDNPAPALPQEAAGDAATTDTDAEEVGAENR
jgi:hypothetical protein